ncbi:MAG: 5-formyltetrahydrofolate cyclo-ligase [Bacillota bacterium]
MDKQTLRETFIKNRKAMPDSMYNMLNTMLVDGLRDVLSEYPLKKIGIFYPIKGMKEVDVRSLGDTYTLHYPKIENDRIVFYEDSGEFERATLGVMEPKDSTPVSKDALDAVIVPGLVYDDGLYRLGYGKGYYDQFLKDYQGLKVGVCFEQFRVEALPNRAHDIPVDILVTDNQVYENEHNEL